MDIINHGVQGFVVGYAATRNLPVSVVLGIFGLLPDLISAIKPDLYDSLHKGKINKYLKWIPTYGLHTWLDSFCHEDGKRWYAGKWYEYFMPWRYKERMWMETASWVIIILLLIILL